MLVLVACGGSSTPTEAPTEVPTRAPFEVATQAPAAQAPANLNSGPVNTTSELLFFNQSSLVICFVYLAPENEEAWGPDLLGNVILGTEGEYQIASIPAGIYNIRFEFCDGFILEEFGIDLTTDFTYTLTD